MNRIVMFSIFLSIFLGIYSLLNYYVLRRMATLANISWGTTQYIIFVILVVSLPAAQALESSLDGPISRVFYAAAFSWAGIVFILACLLAIYEVAHRVIPASSPTWSMIVLSICAIVVVIAIISGQLISVNTVDIASPKIKEPLRIVQISDVHVGPIRNEGHIARIVEKIAAQHPDVVVMTGDIIDGPGKYNPDIFKPFVSLGVPIYFVTGNHEEYAGENLTTLLLTKTGITHLKDTAVDFKGVRIIGIDHRNDKKSVASALEEITQKEPAESKYTILLYHRPSVHPVISGVDLMLSGHTHAGQIFPFTIPTMFVESPVVGLHTIGNLTIYVSPGTGTWGPPMRFGSTNEVTVLNLRPE